ncbi:hypothetical protein [Sporolactobacillus putidus]|uniref:Uncharacterized protein n=1 Tax=Sporolactobacillus putidus TaxID=492735 RepID=A0A917S8Y7_9BACL|nr:hypothetical protein [Sporolactobacillus putidus]GGL62034.1 hypothetical protein GCM10007968_27570 [Sporolactobacillus putidus]
MLFHYHFWTPHLEETENFYKENGFRVSQRVGRNQGKFQTFNPPLTWGDLRNKNVLFRIIEMRKGAVNITFGYGNNIKFDHIGFFVPDADYQTIIGQAKEMKLNVNSNERRTFISTPYGFRIELQKNMDTIDSINSRTKIIKLTIMTKLNDLENFLFRLFGKPVNEIKLINGEKATIKEAMIRNLQLTKCTDPNGVSIRSQ